MKTLIKNAFIVNEGKMFEGFVLIDDMRIVKVTSNLDEITSLVNLADVEEIEAIGKLLLPGVIDDQVHFREPGLTDKGDIQSESRAALLGGVTSFMEMPNCKPATTTIELLEKKFEIASKKSPVNYSFYLGATNDNIEEIKKINPKTICGLKVFMGSSTGNMLVDKDEALKDIFTHSPVIVTTHCEDDTIIAANEAKAREAYGDEIPFKEHPNIRSREACYKSTKKAIELAKITDARLHVLHISTKEELALFEANDVRKKKITAEVCVHHLNFSSDDYEEKGAFIKWNPSIKTMDDREALRQALKENVIDVIATDHAPHTRDEKNSKNYFKTPSGGPLVQFSLQVVLDMWRENVLTLPEVVHKMCHAPAQLFNVKARGFIKEGYFADLVLVDPEKHYEVKTEKIESKCGWSPFEGRVFHCSIDKVWVNGNLKVKEDKIIDTSPGQRLEFVR